MTRFAEMWIFKNKQFQGTTFLYSGIFKYLHKSDGRSFIFRWAQTPKCECDGFQYVKIGFGINTFGGMSCFKILFFNISKIWIYLPYKNWNITEKTEGSSLLWLPLCPFNHPDPRFLLRYCNYYQCGVCVFCIICVFLQLNFFMGA